jgi:hypothetical protein
MRCPAFRRRCHFDAYVIDCVRRCVQSTDYLYVLTRKLLHTDLTLQTVNLVSGAKNPLPASPDAGTGTRCPISTHRLLGSHFLLGTTQGVHVHSALRIRDFTVECRLYGTACRQRNRAQQKKMTFSESMLLNVRSNCSILSAPYTPGSEFHRS